MDTCNYHPWETKEIPSREQRKDKESIWPIPHPPQRIKRTLPPELTKSPLHRAGMIGKRTASTWIPVGTMPHMTSNSRTLITHMPLKARHGSEGTTPKKKERRTRGSKGRGTDQTPQKDTVSNLNLILFSTEQMRNPRMTTADLATSA